MDAQVTYKATKFLDDQVLVKAFAPGGLSDVPRQDFHACSMANMLAEELGQFGMKPEHLLDALMGMRVELGTSEGPFWRVLGGQVCDTLVKVYHLELQQLTLPLQTLSSYCKDRYCKDR